MTARYLGILLLSVALSASACSCGTETEPDPTLVDNQGGDSDGEDSDPDGGTPDENPPGPNPNDPANVYKDTDCDGLSDKEEFETIYAGGLTTNPAIADTDGDGLLDGLEVGKTSSVSGCPFVGDSQPTTTTNPLHPDTDGDGLKDGVEDANHNGKREATETDPLLRDTDCDGLQDGPDLNGVLGEDLNANGAVDAGESDPRKPDTDDDGLIDGLERGVATGAQPDPVKCPHYVGDQDPSTTTDPTLADSDGDGIGDGAEDTNQNGQYEVGELDPRSMADGTGPAAQACSSNNLRTVSFHTKGDPDIQLALPPTFTEVVEMRQANKVVGLMGFDSSTQTAFLVYKRAAPVVGDSATANATADETNLRPTIEGVGALSNPIVKTFTTWDGYAQSVLAYYDQAGTDHVKLRANKLAEALVGTGAGVLPGTATGVGPFQLQAEFVHRSANSVVVLVALAPKSAMTGPALFSVTDTAGGSALAQFSDRNSVQCERFSPGNANVDFVFVVDDSGSMSSSQSALAASATAMVTALNNSSLNWRIAMVTSGYAFDSSAQDNNNFQKLRPFTRDVNQFRAWLTSGSECSGTSSAGTCSGNVGTPAPYCPGGGATGPWGDKGGCWVGLSGIGAEGVLGSAFQAVKNLSPAATTEDALKFRDGANVVIILLGDADDQTGGSLTGTLQGRTTCGTGGNNDKEGSQCIPAADFIEFFQTTNPTGKAIPVHGIICARTDTSGSNCNSEFNPTLANGGQRHRKVITATGGVAGSIKDNASISASISAIVSDVIAKTGYRTQKSPIGASIKVAMSAVQDGTSCEVSDIPRSRANGFDFDGASQRISFFGACRPVALTEAAVSYRYWIEDSSAPDGKAPCQDDPKYDAGEADSCEGRFACDSTPNQCVCPASCGGCGAGLVCVPNTCTCVPDIG